MPHLRNVILIVSLIAPSLLPATSSGAEPETEVAVTAERPYGFLHAGIGFFEILHVEAGGFLTPRLTVEGWLSYMSVFGTHFGGGLTYAFGSAAAGRPPRHAFLVGIRAMFPRDLHIEPQSGDDLPAFGVSPIGYGFVGDSGFSLRATVGPVFSLRNQNLEVGGAFLTLSAGFLVGNRARPPTPPRPAGHVTIGVWSAADCSGAPLRTRHVLPNHREARCDPVSGAGALEQLTCGDDNLSLQAWIATDCLKGPWQQISNKTLSTTHCIPDSSPGLYTRALDLEACD